MAELLANLLQGQGMSPERQAAVTDCMGDALRNSSSLGTTAVALQALQGFVDGNGCGNCFHDAVLMFMPK